MTRGADILKQVTNHYLASDEFNGLPLRVLAEAAGEAHARAMTRALLRDGLVSLTFGDIHPNPHIKAFPEEALDVQLSKLDATNADSICVYPSETHLAVVVDERDYEGRPFTLRLALGRPQLSFAAFDPWVLEPYRNDPRYAYWTDDISGQIGVTDKHYLASEMSTTDKVLLQTFGFCYDDELNRAVMVFLRYLADLSPEHQRVWQTREIKGQYRPHPDYWSQSMGAWREGMSLFEAIGVEMREISRISQSLGRPSLFRAVPLEHRKPKDFAFLLRPTYREYSTFVQVLDKLLADNIQREFFLDDVNFLMEEEQRDGGVFVKEKGTLQGLSEWLDRTFPHEGRADISDVVKAFRKVRRTRQRPAHALDEDAFDLSYHAQQRALAFEIYEAVKKLRVLLATLPGAEAYEYPKRLAGMHVWKC